MHVAASQSQGSGKEDDERLQELLSGIDDEELQVRMSGRQCACEQALGVMVVYIITWKSKWGSIIKCW